MKKFTHLHVPETWKHYWTKYPEGYTILESLLSWVSQVDEMVSQLNANTIEVSEIRDYVESFIIEFTNKFEKNLQSEVSEKLIEWLGNGVLADIINTEVFNMKVDKTQYNDEVIPMISHIRKMSIDIDDYPRYTGEITDDNRFARAIAFLKTQGGGVIQLDSAKYIFNNTLLVPDNVTIKGVVSANPWVVEKNTLLEYDGNSVFLHIESYFNTKATISNINIVKKHTSYTEGVGILVRRTADKWGGGANIDNVTVRGFGVGVKHQTTYNSTIYKSDIWQCGVGVMYDPYIPGSGQDPTSSFGNNNVCEHTMINENKVGVVLAGDTMNTFRYCDIEKSIIGVVTYKTKEGFFEPQQHRFENCWLENNGWMDFNNKSEGKRYLICNSRIDTNYRPTQQGVTGLPTFVNVRNDANISPQIPSFNENYELYNISTPATNLLYRSTASVPDFYNMPEYPVQKVDMVGSGRWRNLYKLSNKGINLELSLNGFDQRKIFEPDPGYTTNKMVVEYSHIVNMLPEEVNYIASHSFMTVFTSHSDGAKTASHFLISDYGERQKLHISKIGVDYEPYSGLLDGQGIHITDNSRDGKNDKTFSVAVTGKLITEIRVKLNYIPSGIFY